MPGSFLFIWTWDLQETSGCLIPPDCNFPSASTPALMFLVHAISFLAVNVSVCLCVRMCGHCWRWSQVVRILRHVQSFCSVAIFCGTWYNLLLRQELRCCWQTHLVFLKKRIIGKASSRESGLVLLNKCVCFSHDTACLSWSPPVL